MINEDQKVIGITGGIASGKSTVAAIIAENGYHVIKSDDTAKELMNSNTELQLQLKQKFGEELFNDRSLNKSYMSSLIFGNSKKHDANRKHVNSIVHPFVIEKNLEQIENHFNSGENIIFVESALIFESGLEKAYDYIITVNSSEEEVISRLKGRNNLSSDDIEHRLDSQISPQYKKSKADFVIENNSDIQSLKKTTEFILSLVLSLPGKDPEKYEKDNFAD